MKGEKKRKVKSESSSREAKKKERGEVGKTRAKTEERERDKRIARVRVALGESRVALRNCTFRMRVTFVRARHDGAKGAKRKSE